MRNRVSVGIVRQKELGDSTSFVQISNNTIMQSLFLSMFLQMKRQKTIMNVPNVVQEPGI